MLNWPSELWSGRRESHAGLTPETLGNFRVGRNVPRSTILCIQSPGEGTKVALRYPDTLDLWFYDGGNCIMKITRPDHLVQNEFQL